MWIDSKMDLCLKICNARIARLLLPYTDFFIRSRITSFVLLGRLAIFVSGKFHHCLFYGLTTKQFFKIHGISVQ